MEFARMLERKVPAGLLMLSLGAAGLAGCGSGEKIDPARPATVVKHHYAAPYTSLAKIGKVWVPIYHAADYDLELRQCDNPDHELSDEGYVPEDCTEETFDVSKEVYDKYPDRSVVTLPLK